MISNGWLKKIYKADEQEKRTIAKGLEKELKTVDSEEKRFELCKKLATAYGYISGTPVLDIKESMNYWLQIKSSQMVSKEDWAWAQIQLCNLYRLDGMVNVAVRGMEDIPNMEISNPRILFEMYWVLAVCSTDNNKRFIRCTQKARELYGKIKNPDIFAIDKYICTGVWLGPQNYRDGMAKLWKSDHAGAEKSFDKSEELLLQAIKDCKSFQISRETDPLLHLAVLYAFCKRDSQKAMELLVQAQRTGVWYVNEFAKIIVPMCMLLSGHEPSRIEEFDLKTNESEAKSWWWVTKIELPLAMMERISKNYAGIPEKIKVKIEELFADSPENDEFPKEFKTGLRMVNAQKQQMLFDANMYPKI